MKYKDLGQYGIGREKVTEDKVGRERRKVKVLEKRKGWNVWEGDSELQCQCYHQAK